jgi:hypothetical protein
MTITLELTPEEEVALRGKASRRGLAVEDYVKRRALEENTDAPAANDPDLIARLMRIGREASEAAVRELHAQGIATVFMRDGVLYEEAPDGTVRRLEAK